MNWKEVAYLFANGKFKVKWYHENSDFIDDVNLGKESWMITTNNIIKNCKLIARPISDMNESEKQSFYECCDFYGNGPDSYKDYKKDMIDLHKNDQYLDEWDELKEIEQFANDRDGFLYLLSIGIYPFNQVHFKTVSLINKTKL